MTPLIVLTLLIKMAATLKVQEVPGAGLFFEELRPLKFIRDTWRVTIVIDYNPTRYNLPYLEGCFERFQQDDIFDTEDQQEIVKLREKFAKAQERFEEIMVIYQGMDASLTDEEGKFWMHQSDMLRHVKNGIITMKKTKTILLESSLSQMTARVKEDIKDLMQDINRARNPSNNQYQRKAALKRAIQGMGIRLERLLENGTEIVRSIMDLKNRITRPALMDSGAVRSVIEQLNQEAGYQLPPAEKLGEIITTTSKFMTQEARAFIEFHVPLLNRETYTLYKVNTLPVSQSFENHTVGLAFIQPRNDYVISENGDQYYALNKKEWGRCFRTINLTLCPSKWFMFRRAAACEASLLNSKKDINFHTCDIRFTKDYQPSISKLTISDNWVYSVDSTIALDLTCNATTTEVKINGTGILDFDPECVLSLEGEKFPSGNGSNVSRKRLIFPEKSLDLWQTASMTPEMTKIFLELTNTGAVWDFWEVVQKSKDQVQGQTKELIYLVYIISLTTILTMTLAGVTGIVYLLCYFKRVLSEEGTDPEEGIIREPRVDDQVE